MKDQEVISVLNALASKAYKTAVAHGFHSEDPQLFEYCVNPGQISWLEATTHQAEIARMHSELSEALETVRTNPQRMDDHLPEFYNVVVEYADCIIRILDTCASRGLPIGEALVAKMKYNESREYKHGKNS